MAAKKLNLTVRQGETFLRVIRWETPPFIYKAITAITKAGPVVVTAVAHGLKSGWRAAVVSVVGMDEINADHSPPRDHNFHQVTVLSVDTVEINDINSADFDTYVSGGYLQFYTPVNMTGFTARMTIKDKIGGTVLDTLVPTIDAVNNTITLTISAVDTALFTWKKGVYDLEMVSAGGVVTTIFAGSVTLTQEVTT
jgi:hypothetical protein